MSRLLDLVEKAWLYLLLALEQPTWLPPFVWHVGFRSVHAGELLKLIRFHKWLKDIEIGTVIDVGAHTGEFSSAVKALFPEVNLYAFEPLPDCQPRLKERLNRHKNVEVYATALGNQEGEISFWKSTFSKASSVLPMSELHKQAFPWSASSVQVNVPVSKLDSYLPKIEFAKRALLKIDVQGYELDVLAGAEQTLVQLDYVVVETSFKPLYEGQSSFSSVYDYLRLKGFEYSGCLDQLQSPIDQSILQADALFIRKSE